MALMLLPFMFSPELRAAAAKDKRVLRDAGKWQTTPFYHPKRTKFKGWMRERRRCTFNKNK